MAKKQEPIPSSSTMRAVVRIYTKAQQDRLRQQARQRESEEAEIFQEFVDGFLEMEAAAHRRITKMARLNPVCKWQTKNTGVGEVLSVGIVSEIDIERAPTAGALWSFAGLNPNVKWEKGQKRPWNGTLRRWCWLLGESFVRQSFRPTCQYGLWILERKKYEWERNLSGKLSDQAALSLSEKNYKKDTAAYAWYSGQFSPEQASLWLQKVERGEEVGQTPTPDPENGVPMLPPARIHERAKRWGVKLHLSHLHHVMYVMLLGKEPPLPYPIVHLGHVHIIDVPHWPMRETVRTK